MSGVIKTAGDGVEYLSTEGCHILELSNGPGDAEISIARARVTPGVTTRWHRLRGTVERYVVVAGAGRVEIGAMPPHEVYEGSVVIIPPFCAQRITNIGASDLIFLAICTPPFRWDVYEDIDDTTVP